MNTDFHTRIVVYQEQAIQDIRINSWLHIEKLQTVAINQRACWK